MTDDDQIIEPGEDGAVTSLTISNIGPMPSPIHSFLFTEVVENDHVLGIGSL